MAAHQGNNNRVQEILQGISDEKLRAIIEHEYRRSADLVYYTLQSLFTGDQRPYEETALLCASERGYVNIIENCLHLESILMLNATTTSSPH